MGARVISVAVSSMRSLRIVGRAAESGSSAVPWRTAALGLIRSHPSFRQHLGTARGPTMPHSLAHNENRRFLHASSIAMKRDYYEVAPPPTAALPLRSALPSREPLLIS